MLSAGSRYHQLSTVVEFHILMNPLAGDARLSQLRNRVLLDACGLFLHTDYVVTVLVLLEVYKILQTPCRALTLSGGLCEGHQLVPESRKYDVEEVMSLQCHHSRDAKLTSIGVRCLGACSMRRLE
jgi:hypothetical protein